MSQTPKPHAPENYRPRVSDIIHSASFNKGTAFSETELDAFRLRGLLPPKIETLDQQAARVIAQLHRCNTPLEKYIFLSTLHNRNETLFYRVVLDNLTETLPIIYTPTVGEACVKFSSIWTTTRGMYLALLRDRTQVRSILDNWIHDDVQIIVVTDGSRILGLGDLGVNGMGIPIGKLSLYVAGSGFAPTGTLPIALDTGTNTEKFLNDPEYLGNYTPRIKGEEYLAFLDEFMAAVHDKWPEALVQFEDFSNDTAFLLLNRYRQKYLCFNDDIQGTGAVVCSGFINSLRLAKIRPHDVRIVFLGAGSAGVGVADMIARYICSQTGVTPEQARTQIWFVDSRGLLTANRGTPFEPHKIPYLRQDNGDRQISDLYEIIDYVRPNALIGLSGIGGSFSDKVLTLMGEINDRPIIMALSNPTSNAECTAVQAYTLTKGRAIFASGSPFDPVEYEGKTFITGQGNNMFIFPGLGFGAYLCNASQVSDAMIVASAEVLSQYVSDDQIEAGNIYPSVSEVRKISVLIAARVIAVAKEEGLTSLDLPTDLQSWVESQMYVPHYV